MWLKKDLAMTMVSLVVILFVFCMLLAGLVLRIRQCWSQRNFRLQQERLCQEESLSPNGNSPAYFQPPPRYSEVVDSNDNLRDDKYQDNNTSATVALCPHTAASSHHISPVRNSGNLYRSVTGGETTTEISCDSGINDMAGTEEETEALCDGRESLYTLQDHGDSGSFDSVFLSISLPDYEEAVGQLEKQGLRVDSGMLQPMPPAYTQVTF